MDNMKNTVILAAIIGASVIASASIGALALYRIRALDNTLSVTGSAKKEVRSDQVRFTGAIVRTATQSSLGNGYAQVARDLEITKAFLKDNGIAESEYTVSPVYTDQVYKQNEAAEKEYNLRQTIIIDSTNVDGVTALAKNTQALVAKGVFFQNNNLEYLYSKLAEERISLLADAVKDARSRAEQLAQSGGKKVGYLKSASSGVVQVLAPHSIEVSDYGAYDTQSIAKEIMVTARAVFTIK